MIFSEIGNQVLIKYTALDQSRYDGEYSNFQVSANFRYTDKDTITITNNQVVRRSKILGKNRQFIVFFYISPNLPELKQEAYHLVQI